MTESRAAALQALRAAVVQLLRRRGGASLFRGSNFTNPFTEENERNRGYTIFATLGGEYRFARRLGLSYLVQRSAVLDQNGVGPLVELGLRYYF